MSDMNASIFEEIQDQNLDGTSAGTDANPDSWVSSIVQGPLWCGLSYLGGNDGRLCTLTVECQASC